MPEFIGIDKYEGRIKFVILGNSITLHPVIKGLWEHESGMAASDKEHDYVHVLMNKVSIENKCGVEFIVLGIADFERGFEEYDFERLSGIRNFSPDILIIQIGENVTKSDIIEQGELFVKKYIELIDYFDIENTIICLPFWPDKDKIEKITEVALRKDVYLVDLSHLGSGIEPLNFARSENKYKHTGVAAHPGDFGMKNIANLLYIAVRRVIEE